MINEANIYFVINAVMIFVCSLHTLFRRFVARKIKTADKLSSIILNLTL